MSGDAPRLLIPFCDDSTLIFAVRLRALLRAAAPEARITLGCYLPEQALSLRQLEMLVPAADYALFNKDGLIEAVQEGQYDAVLTSRVFRALANALRTPPFKHLKARAQVISFLGGLDFYPERGYANRMPCDGVFLFPQDDTRRFAAWAAEQAEADSNVTAPLVDFGHPTFLRPDQAAPDAQATLPDQATPAAPEARRDIYFFAQAISPLTRRGRRHVLEAMVALAEANPDRTVWIKLRHLPDENTRHLHRERHDYPGLLAQAFPAAPENLKLTACPMDQATAQAALGITCTSTAAIDLIREGVPTMVYLDYVDAYMDPMAAAMRRLFEGSGVITSLEDLLHLRAPTPDPDWVAQMFCPRDLGQRVLDMVAALQARSSASSG